MYASARGDTGDLVSAIGVGPGGAIERLGLRTIGDSDDPLIVEAMIRRAINDGTAQALCESIADRISASSTSTVSLIEIVTERHVLVEIASDAASTPLDRTVHGRCMT